MDTPRFQVPDKRPDDDREPGDMVPRSSGSEKIWLEVRNDRCSDCALGFDQPGTVAKTVCLTGDGPVPARGMIVGEGPGYREDELERNFMGDAGEYLNNLLMDVGIEPGKLFKSNVTKCRPPRENKDDLVIGAVKPCKPYLLEEIRRVKPEVILVMGNPALRSLTGMSGVTKKRGMEFYDEDLGAWIIVTLHPSFVLRSPNKHPELFADLKKFARRLSGESEGESTRPDVIFCDTVEKVYRALEELKDEKVVTVDLETQGFDHFRGERKIWCLALSADPKKAYLVPLEHPESPFVDGPELFGEGYSYQLAKKKKSKAGEAIRGWLEKPWTEVARPELHEVWAALKVFIEAHQMCGHNIKFDAIWMAGRDIDALVWFDTMMAAHILNENREMNLESISITELGVQGWGKRKVQFNPPDSLSIMGPYCGADGAYDHWLYLLFRESLSNDQDLARLYLRVSMPAVTIFKKAELCGIYLDEVRARDRLETARSERSGVEKTLCRKLPRDLQGLADEAIVKGKSVFNSPDFLSKWLYGDPPHGLGLKPSRRTKRGWSTDEKDLKRLSSVSGEVAEILEFRSWKKKVEFFESWLAAVGPDGRVHPSFNLVGTVTGRKSSGFHTVPREDTRAGLRSAFGEEEGWTFVEADFSQIELRIAAWLADEPTMIAIFKNGGDIHLYTAALVTGKLYELQDEMGFQDLTVESLSVIPEFNEQLRAMITKDERRGAKAVNFGFLYGMGARSFKIYAKESYGVDYTIEECEEFRNSYFITYSALVSWHEKQRRIVRSKMEVVSPIGRVRRLPMILSSEWELQGKAERQAINSLPQGLAPDLVQLAVNVLCDEFGDWSEARFIGEVHDSALFGIRTDCLARWIPRIKHVMEHPPVEELFNVEVPVPLEVDIAIGSHWGETSEEAAQEYLDAAA